MKRLLLIAWATALKLSGGLWWAKRELRRRGAIVVLTFHRVLSPADQQKASSLPGILVGQKLFEDLSAYIVRCCQAVDAGSARPGEVSAKLRVAYTFDDGWRDNYTTALPILKKYSIPATVFACPGLDGVNLPFWPEKMVALLRAQPKPMSSLEIETAIERWKHRAAPERNAYIDQLKNNASVNHVDGGDQLVNIQEAIQMAKSGIRLGSHTHHHELLTMIPASTIRTELRDSKRAIEKNWSGAECSMFAYPNGDWTLEARELVSEAGYKRAFTTEICAWTAESDLLTIPRVNIYDGKLTGLFGRFSPAVFEYTVFWRAWRGAQMQSPQKIPSEAPAAAAVETN